MSSKYHQIHKTHHHHRHHKQDASNQQEQSTSRAMNPTNISKLPQHAKPPCPSPSTPLLSKSHSYISIPPHTPSSLSSASLAVNPPSSPFLSYLPLPISGPPLPPLPPFTPQITLHSHSTNPPRCEEDDDPAFHSDAESLDFETQLPKKKLRQAAERRKQTRENLWFILGLVAVGLFVLHGFFPFGWRGAGVPSSGEGERKGEGEHGVRVRVRVRVRMNVCGE